MSQEYTSLSKELVPQILPLESIYLDPNNPRFVGMDWDDVSEDMFSDDGIQARVQEKLIREFSIDKLILNIETNGFLCIDRVIVKEFEDHKYVVLEGNRRICAAKMLLHRYTENSSSVGEDIIDSLRNIHCLVYTGSDSQPAWIFQGLRHIMGIYDWSAFNKAKLLVKIMEDENLSLTTVGKKFGLSAYGAGQWVRGYSAFTQAAEESDYTKEVDERAYPFFQELFSRSNASIREWMDWDDKCYRFKNELNFNEFLSWLYPREDEELSDGVDSLGDWSNRKLTKRDDIRNVSYLIRESPSDFTSFRNDGDIEKAYSIATSREYKLRIDPAQEAFDNIAACIKSLENLPFRVIMKENERLTASIKKLKEAISEIDGHVGD